MSLLVDAVASCAHLLQAADVHSMKDATRGGGEVIHMLVCVHRTQSDLRVESLIGIEQNRQNRQAGE